MIGFLLEHLPGVWMDKHGVPQLACALDPRLLRATAFTASSGCLSLLRWLPPLLLLHFTVLLGCLAFRRLRLRRRYFEDYLVECPLLENLRIDAIWLSMQWDFGTEHRYRALEAGDLLMDARMAIDLIELVLELCHALEIDDALKNCRCIQRIKRHLWQFASKRERRCTYTWKDFDK